MPKRRKLSEDPFVQACQRHGVTTVMRSVTYVACWAWTSHAIGHAPTNEEYREYWAMSRPSVERERAAFKKCTGLKDPTTIVERARAAGLEFEKSSARNSGGLALVPFMPWDLA